MLVLMEHLFVGERKHKQLNIQRIKNSIIEVKQVNVRESY